MAEEDFSDLGEVKLTHYDGHRWTSGWGRSPGSGIAVIPHQYPRTFLNSYHNNSRPAEAEDIMGRHYNHSSRMHQKTGGGFYYSPPGTSYTIVEKPSASTMSASHPQSKQRVRTAATPVTVTASSSSAPNSKILSNSNSNKKRPISPEQVLKLFSSHTTRNRNNNNNCSNSYNLNNSNINSNNTSKSTVSTDTYAQQSHRYQPPDIDKLPVKTITMTRDTPITSANHGFGICVKGGCSKKTDNVGVYISRVEEGSIAEKSGLRPGDSILEVNGIPFTNISHDEALKILKSCRQISMTIRMSPLTRIEGCWVRQSYSWMDRMGRQVSPPPDYSKVTPTATSDRWPPSRLSKEKVRKVELNIEPGQSLGLMIRGGSEYNLGIFVTGVDKNSVADRAGIQIGDQILDVNGTSFLDISHDNAVEHLKKHKRMTITIRDVGKIPHSISTFDSNPSVDCNTYRGAIQPRVPRLETNNMQMVEEKATSVLKKCEYATLCYYLEEYCSKRMTFETFIAVLFDLLNSPEKFTLMTELREIVNPHDRSRFDEIVYRGHSLDNSRNYYNMRERLKGDTSGRISPTLQNLPPTGYANANNYLNEENIALYEDPDEFRSPSEDSGLGMGPQDFAKNRISRDRNSLADPSWKSQSRHLDRESHIEEDLGYNQEYGDYDTELLPRGRRRSSLSDTIPPLRGNNPGYEDANMCGYLEGIRSQLGGWTQKVKDWYWGNPFQLAQKLGRGCDIKDEKDPKTNAKKEGSAENAAHIVPDQFGNLRITVKKTKPLLGIAIEGGVNTKHPLPRIINIHENGAAFEAGGLEVGQLILEVDRQKVEGMQHQAIARLIAETYANRDRKEIEFLVIEAKKSNLEPKPTALIFMDS